MKHWSIDSQLPTSFRVAVNTGWCLIGTPIPHQA